MASEKPIWENSNDQTEKAFKNTFMDAYFRGRQQTVDELKQWLHFTVTITEGYQILQKEAEIWYIDVYHIIQA